MHLVPVSNAVLSSVLMGEEGARPAVLVHGLMFGNMATWYTSLAPQLAETHRVVLYDQRGHGDSPVAADGYGIRSQTEDLHAVLSHHGIGSEASDVVGHSMGAVIALHFALRFPHLVRRLVIIDAPLPMQEHVLPELMAVDEPAVLDRYIRERQGEASGRRLARLHDRLARLFFHSTLVGDLLAEPEVLDESMAALKRRVLLVYGRRSEYLASGQRLTEILPDARLELLDCGHYIVEEAPNDLRRLIIPFLTECN